MNRHRTNDTHEHVTFTYFAQAKNNVVNQPIEREKSGDCKWFTKIELETLSDITQSVRTYALRALEEVVY